MPIQDTIFDAQWVVDSETSEQFLLDKNTGRILARKDKDGNWMIEGELHGT